MKKITLIVVCFTIFHSAMGQTQKDTTKELQEVTIKVYIPDHVDPPFLFMLTHHSCMLTHPGNVFPVCVYSCPAKAGTHPGSE